MLIAARDGGAAAIRKIVLHLNAGPEVEGGAAGLVHYLQSIEGGYHEVVDDKTFIVCARPDQRVAGAAGMNARGYHICLIGQPQDAAGWADTYSRGELAIAIQRVAAACHAFALPPVQLSDPEVATVEVRGICDHWAVNRAIQHGDHIDVGPGFPWLAFITDVVRVYSSGSGSAPAPGTPSAPSQEDEVPTFVNPKSKVPFAPQHAWIDLTRREIVLVNGAQLRGVHALTVPGVRWYVPIPSSGVGIRGAWEHVDHGGFTVLDNLGHGFVYRWA